MQILKPELRQRVLDAAEGEFAEAGYRGATMAAIAARAGVSTGNLYRYFAGKDALFGTLFPTEFADELLRLLRKRVRSLTLAADLETLDATAQADAEELLAFWIANRRKVVVLLDRADGSPFADFRERFVDAILAPTTEALRAAAGGRRLTPVERRLVRGLFDNTVRMIVMILESASTPDEVRESFAGFWSYQLAGLTGLTRWVTT